MVRAPVYPRGVRAVLAAMWQRIRWQTWRAFPPADDHGIERGHVECAGKGPHAIPEPEHDERLWFDEERP